MLEGRFIDFEDGVFCPDLLLWRAEEAGNDVYFGKVLIPDELSLADEYEISSVPTLLYFKDGEIREKSVGFTHKLIIAENIKKL